MSEQLDQVGTILTETGVRETASMRYVHCTSKLVNCASKLDPLALTAVMHKDTPLTKVIYEDLHVDGYQATTIS